jgi:hypothetical protein
MRDLGRDGDAHWTLEPERALVAALRARLPAHAVLAAPAWGLEAYADLLEGLDVRWMEPAHHRLDPGRSEIAAALDQGATGVLLAPVAGDCASLLGVAELCARRGAVLALDARASAGGRVLDGAPGTLGDLTVVPVDGEPGPAPCPGAFLIGAEPGAPREAAASRLHAAALVRASVRAEPRLRALWRPTQPDGPVPRSTHAPSWAFAGAAARLQQSATRASQRARHGRTLRRSLSFIEGVDLPPDPTGVQSAGGALGLLVAHRDEVRRRLAGMGISTLDGGGWLAPTAGRAGRAAAVAEQALLLPLLPFYRPRDLDHIGECLRRAALKAATPG